MDEILKFHIEWQERQKCLIKMPSSLIISFIICWLILLCIDFLFIYKEPIHFIIGYYALQLFLAVCLWIMLHYFFKVKEAKYKNLIKEYEKLLTIMGDDTSPSDNKKYYKIFCEYARFMGIQEKMNEREIFKKLRKIPGAKEYSEENLKDIAQAHVTKIKMMDDYIGDMLLQALTK